MGLFGINLAKGRNQKEFSMICMAMGTAAAIRQRENDYTEMEEDQAIARKLKAGKNLTKDEVRTLVSEMEMTAERLPSVQKEKEVIRLSPTEPLEEEHVLAIADVFGYLAKEIKSKYL